MNIDDIITELNFNDIFIPKNHIRIKNSNINQYLQNLPNFLDRKASCFLDFNDFEVACFWIKGKKVSNNLIEMLKLYKSTKHDKLIVIFNKDKKIIKYMVNQAIIESRRILEY